MILAEVDIVWNPSAIHIVKKEWNEDWSRFTSNPKIDYVYKLCDPKFFCGALTVFYCFFLLCASEITI